MIPKPGVGERPLGIPTIRDRVEQTAAKLILEPILEADLEPNGYGYRPKKSAQDAIQEVDKSGNRFSGWKAGSVGTSGSCSGCGGKTERAVSGRCAVWG